MTGGTGRDGAHGAIVAERHSARRSFATRLTWRTLLPLCLLASAALALLLSLRLSGAGNARAQAEPEPIPVPVVLVFGPGADRTQDGWVMISRQPRSRQTGVQIELAPLVTAPQHAAIYMGHCTDAAPGDIAFQLSDATAGESMTTLDTSRRGLFNGTMSIRVQGTDSDPSLFTACVDLPLRHMGLGSGPHRNQPTPPPAAD
ncbi:MAG TPA: hypothetical protein VKV26_14085 [Dehalococcoidia bacterium]|nr:hypothetical protein [Dehalococcoidia bacterium]